MTATVKQKIRWGTLFLFLLMLTLGGVAIFHIVRLKHDSQVILKNNYESLEYCHFMLRTLDSIDIDKPVYMAKFDSVLKLQEANLTEEGERQFTAGIRRYFDLYKKGEDPEGNFKKMEENIHEVLGVNMAAIEFKNSRANDTANHAVSYLTFIATAVFLIGLTFAFNFPFVITNPINAFTEGIKQVSAKNYHHRIHLDRKDEFGQMAQAFNNMAERLEYFESSNLNKIIFEKTRAEAVINSLKDASIGIDKNGIVLFANSQALQLLGMEAAQLVARPVREIVAKNDLFRFLMEEKGNVPFKVVVGNEENYFIKETVDIEEDGSGGRVVVLKNITSFKELDVAKTNLLATISHELKTPLASSDFSIKLLQDERTGKLNREQAEYVNNLKEDNRRMLKILSELLNMAQIETGKIQLDIADVSPVSIADNAIETVMNAAKDKNVIIKKDYGPSPGTISADAEKTAWVLNNFLTNAIKYSPAGETITVSVRNKESEVEFSVTDRGPGIPSEYHKKVFDRFFRVPGANGRGSGLGLAISKEFIDAQGGRVWVKSEIGTGSVFGFTLASRSYTVPPAHH